METDHRILIVDDEPAVRRFLQTVLSGAGYSTCEAGTGVEALEALKAKRPDAMLLDLCLPDITGLEVLQVLREWSKVPVLMLSVQDQEVDIVSALDAGADDYLCKPFRTAELLARLRSTLRRTARESTAEIFTSGGVRVDLLAHTVTLDGESVNLTPTEYDLLKVFITNAGRLLTHTQLLRAVWGNGYAEDIGILRVNISNLRKKLEHGESSRRIVVTEPGVGYRLLVG